MLVHASADRRSLIEVMVQVHGDWSGPQAGELRFERLDLATALRELLAERIADERVLRLLGFELRDRRGGLAEYLALRLGVRAAEQRFELVDAVVDALAPLPFDLFLRVMSEPLSGSLGDARGLLFARSGTQARRCPRRRLACVSSA